MYLTCQSLSRVVVMKILCVCLKNCNSKKKKKQKAKVHIKLKIFLFFFFLLSLLSKKEKKSVSISKTLINFTLFSLSQYPDLFFLVPFFTFTKEKLIWTSKGKKKEEIYTQLSTGAPLFHHLLKLEATHAKEKKNIFGTISKRNQSFVRSDLPTFFRFLLLPIFNYYYVLVLAGKHPSNHVTKERELFSFSFGPVNTK